MTKEHTDSLEWHHWDTLKAAEAYPSEPGKLSSLITAARNRCFAALQQPGAPERNEAIDLTQRLRASVHSGIQQGALQGHINPLLDDAAKELHDDPALAASFRTIILEGNRGALKEKCRRQIEDLQRAYFGQVPRLAWFRRRKLTENLERFRRWIGDGNVIRQDGRLPHLEEFQAPYLTGNVNSYGYMDTLVQADKYVYASLDVIPHHMTSGTKEHQAVIDTQDANARGEIAMMDIAHIAHRHDEHGGKSHACAAYMRNLFDFEGGKEILALYLAFVFDDPREAFIWINGSSDPNTVEHWDERTDERGHQFRDEEGQWQWASVPAERTREIVKRMVFLLQKFGLEPPLAAEVRIRDRANIVRGRTAGA